MSRMGRIRNSTPIQTTYHHYPDPGGKPRSHRSTCPRRYRS